MPRFNPQNPSPKTPKYRLHKPTGQAVVTLNGHDHYLGDHNTEESRRAYDRLIAEWLLGGRAPISQGHDITMAELLDAFWQHAKKHYRSDGKPTTSLDNFRSLIKVVLELYLDVPVSEFSPRSAMAVRERMITERNWCRRHVNQQMGRIKSILKWGVQQELVPPDVYGRVNAVQELRRGRCQARESLPVKPVPQADIDAIEPYVSRQVWAMIQLQLLTGMRPGEVVIMRACDIDMSDEGTWVYTPQDHKTAYRGHSRTVCLGPKAQRIIEPLLRRDLMSYVFSPSDAEKERADERRRTRKSPVQPSQVRRAELARRRADAGLRQRMPADRYDVGSYRQAIQRACDIALPAPPPLGQRDDETRLKWLARLKPAQRKQLTEWQKEHRWHPHQLRHNAATALRKKFGIETARAVLGHRSTVVTEIYAEMDEAKTRQVMAEVG
jgi:integrase